MSPPLRIGIDGRGIYKTIDGIGRYSLNLIRNLAAIPYQSLLKMFLIEKVEEELRMAK